MICEFTISPLGAGESLSKEVAAVIDLIDKSGLAYRTHAMGTIVEGSWDEIMDLIKRCHFLMRRKHHRVITNIHIDDREGATHRIDGKVDALERHLERKIRR